MKDKLLRLWVRLLRFFRLRPPESPLDEELEDPMETPTDVVAFARGMSLDIYQIVYAESLEEV